MSSVRFLTLVIFAYTTVEGLVINVMYPNTLPFIFKDFAILAAYVAMMSGAHSFKGSLSRISAPLMMFAVVTCFFLVMPSPIELLGRLVAVKQRLFYIPLAWLGYAYLQSDDDLLALVKLMAWTAIPASAFGIYLYFTGPIGLASLGANYSAIVGSTSGEHGVSFWRVPGTFTSPGQFGGFLLINTVLFAGTLFEPTVSRGQRLLTIVALVIALGALMVSGSRSPLLFFVMSCVVFLAVTGRVKGIGVWAGGLYSVLTLGFSFFGDGVQDRIGSIASWEHVERFNDTYLGQLFWPMLINSPMGFGLGRATLGARHFTDWSNIMLVESYFGILVAETGVLGFLGFFVAIVSLIFTLLKCHPVMKTAPQGVLWYACVMPVLITAMLMPVNTGVDSAPCNLYFWFFLGIALKMYDREVTRRRFGTPTADAAMASQRHVYPVSYQ